LSFLQYFDAVSLVMYSLYSLDIRSHMGQPLLSDISVNGACISLATFVMPTLVKTILKLFRPACIVLPKTGDAEEVDRGKPD